MKLKKIEIIGFKSFADKTVLEFHDGVTAVVGPNGCGKSNISDAFRWVMGEQSAKSMRGNKMLDVIFAGTTNRKPLNYCEVTITLSDIQDQLPVDYEEVSVTRRLHRNGESDYLINRKPARLKDIQELLLDSGMGKNSFSMFEQGKLDQVINYTPLERRTIFEEASGIMRFLQRKKEALRKLEHTDNNLSRVQDILQEVERQIIVLEEQAEKATLYKGNKALFESLEKALFLAKWGRLRKRAENADEKQGDQNKKIQEAETVLHDLEEELKQAKDLLFEGEKKLQEQNETLYQTRSTKEIKTKERQTQQERLQEAIAKEQQWLQELGSMDDKRKIREQESEEFKEKQKESEQKLEKLNTVQQSQNEKLHAIEVEVNQLRDQQGEIQRELLSLMHLEKKCESELNQNVIRLEGNQERKKRIQERREKATSSIQEVLGSLESKKLTASETSGAVARNKEQLSELESHLQILKQQIKDKQVKLDSVLRNVTEHRARQKMLFRLREEMEGFSKGSKRILKEAANSGTTLFEKVKGLYEYISPNSGSEKALSTALRPYAQTLVVESHEDFQAVVDFAKENQLKDYSLLCLNSLKGQDSEKSMEGIVPLLSQVAENSVSKHFLNSIFVAESLEQAWSKLQESSGIEILVKDGLFIDKRGVAFYTTTGENNAFLREAELKSLMKKVKEAEAEEESLQKDLEEDKQRQEEKLQAKTTLEKQIREVELKQVEAEFAVKRLQSDLERAQNDSQQHEKELHALDESSLQLSQAINTLKEKHSESHIEASEKQKKADSLKEELEEKVSALKVEQVGMQEKTSAYQNVAEENRRLMHQINVLDVKNQESQDHEKRLQEEIESSRQLQEQIKERFAEYDEVLASVEQRLSEVNSQNSELVAEVSKRREGITEAEEKLEGERGEIKKFEEELYEIKIQAAQLLSSREALENEFIEHYHMTLNDLDPEENQLEESIEKSERKLRSLRNQLESAGDINMTSIEEFEKHKSRYEFLSQQMDDLNEAKNELIQIITQLDTESRKIFMETFEQIRSNFRKNFGVLFHGGEADLEFTEAEDVLEAGIEIIAKPPGKQMRSINLLSGGEKCLTAVALMFAIFEVKPAPFCILDEIDAPLDDTNVQRFVNVVKQFVDRCQFIIITHNKGTMEIADILFGVSMQEKGVSKLLAIELSEESEPEPVLVSS